MSRATKYKPEMCQKIIDHMKTGKSLSSFAYSHQVGRRTVYDWQKKYPDFEVACSVAHSAALGFYENLLMAKITGVEKQLNGIGPINMKGLIFVLRTRFHYVYGRNALTPMDITPRHERPVSEINDPDELKQFIHEKYEQIKHLEFQKEMDLFQAH